MSSRPKRYYYYAGERGCLRDPNSVDAIGVGVEDGAKSCALTINLIRLGRHGENPRFSMEVSAHSDEWSVFSECRDVLDLLSKKVVRHPDAMTDMEPFYALRIHLEKLGYRNLGVLTH